jgi:hypothetical protein
MSQKFIVNKFDGRRVSRATAFGKTVSYEEFDELKAVIENLKSDNSF